MRISLFKQAALLAASAFALAPHATQAQSSWTTLTAGQLDSYSFVHAHHPDGRFLFGTDGTVSLQDDFTTADFTPIDNTAAAIFDPSFIAVRSASEGLIGGGGSFGPSGVFAFDPSSPATPINGTPVFITQNYGSVWWQHPTSGRAGWLIVGGNGVGGASNLIYLSADGAISGPVTYALSSWSGGLDAHANGDVFTVLADLIPAVENLVIKFDADQIDAAVLAILNSTPAPLDAGSATVVFRAAASGALAVDGAGRLWTGGWQINYLQAHDPATGVTRRFHPLSSPPANHVGPPNFAPKAFSQGGVDRVSFLANDSSYVFGSDFVLGHAKVEDLIVRSVQFANVSATLNEGGGSVSIDVTMTPPPTETVTVPLIFSGTATAGADFVTPPAQVVFQAGEDTQQIVIEVIDDAVVGEPDETIVIALGAPAPEKHAGLGAPATDVFTITIEDNDVPPVILRDQPFPALQVGVFFTYQMQTTRAAATSWRVTGLPPGLSIDADGVISGIPTTAGEFDRVILTATNAFGSTTSIVFLLPVAPMPATVVGGFNGLVDRDGTATDGLGAWFELVTTARAKFTAKLRIGKRTASAKGDIASDSGGATTGTAIFRIGGVQHSLDFAIDPTDGSLSGQLLNGGELSGFRQGPNPVAASLCNFSLFQTGIIPDDKPQGAATGSLTLPLRGKARAAVRLPDNSAFTNSGALGADGTFLLYQALYRVPGSFSGQLEIASDLELSLSGDFTWSKPAQTSGALYRNGWTGVLDLKARGGKYRAPAGATLPLDATPSNDENALLVLQDGGIDDFGANPLESALRILAINKLVQPAGLKLKLNPRNGALGGSLRVGAGAAARTVVLRGLLVPDETTANPFDSIGQGFFTLPTATRGVSRSGLLLLEPSS